MADALNPSCKMLILSPTSFEDRFGMLVDTEWAKRRSTKLQKLIRTADFDTPMHAWKILSIFKTES